QAQVTYAERPLVFKNDGQGRFDEVGKELGFGSQIVARGAACGDIDNDGYLDVLVTTNNGPAYLFRNEGPNTANAIRIKTVGTQSNRNGIGARVRVRSGGAANWQTVHSGSSYCSQSELPLTFGLGKAGSAEEVHIIWPSGHEDTHKNLKANASYIIQEGGKLLSTRPFKR
ncbi:MAG TPA: CRTAC1 family protein, partial [Terriglobia bacterium]|nr:CRTAC1 family protein [Terriglobia bacterium]